MSLKKKNSVELTPPIAKKESIRPVKVPQPTTKTDGGRPGKAPPLTTRTDSVNKLKLPPPTTMTDVVREVTLQIARKYLFLDLYKRAICYLIIVGVLSLMVPYLPLPQDWYWAQRYNFFNQWGVKLSWFWTSTLTGSFIYLTASVYGCGDLMVVGRHMTRMLVGTAIWYFCTTWFVDIERMTGSCMGFATKSRSLCAANGGKWVPGFDISGHCFLLIYCCMLICEEARAFRDWDKLRSLLDHPEQDYSAFTGERPSKAEIDESRATHERMTIPIKILFIVLFFVHLIWEFMILITVLYYHTFAHKMMGTGIALAAWFVTYQLWYKTPVSPGTPGAGKVNYRDRSLSRTR
uniref:Uncharacterized protein n=1 Tax=Plectus sambesii TaxID=2011161 RepID=A0A914XP27_9BILA